MPDFEDEFMAPKMRATMEASFCGIGCESESTCSHAPFDFDAEADDAYAQDFGDWLEATFAGDDFYCPDAWKAPQSRFDASVYGY